MKFHSAKQEAAYVRATRRRRQALDSVWCRLKRWARELFSKGGGK